VESAAADATRGKRSFRIEESRRDGAKSIRNAPEARPEGRRRVKKSETGANVYAQLGFPDAEAKLVKAQLVSKIGEILRKGGWSQQQAAKVLGLTQPKLSKMLRGQFRGISEIKMMDCLVRLGRPVKIVVGPESKAASCIEVVAA